MNIFDVFKQLEKDDTKSFTNGYNRLRPGQDSYELELTDTDMNEIIVLMSGWKEE